MNKYDKIAADYSNKRKKPWKYFIEFLDTLIDKNLFDVKNSSGTCIDLGCGAGRHSSVLSEIYDSYLGIDLSQDMVEIAKKDGRYNQNWLVCDMENLPLRSNCAESVVSIAVIHHILSKSSQEVVLCRLKDILKENGLFILSVWSTTSGKISRLFKKNNFRNRMRKESNISRKRVIVSQNNNKIIIKDNIIYLPWSAAKKGGEKLSIDRLYNLFSFNRLQIFWEDFTILEKGVLGPEKAGKNYFLLLSKNKN